MHDLTVQGPHHARAQFHAVCMGANVLEPHAGKTGGDDAPPRPKQIAIDDGPFISIPPVRLRQSIIYHAPKWMRRLDRDAAHLTGDLIVSDELPWSREPRDKRMHRAREESQICRLPHSIQFAGCLWKQFGLWIGSVQPSQNCNVLGQWLSVNDQRRHLALGIDGQVFR